MNYPVAAFSYVRFRFYFVGSIGKPALRQATVPPRSA
jgi:hypothetical protein